MINLEKYLQEIEFTNVDFSKFTNGLHKLSHKGKYRRKAYKGDKCVYVCVCSVMSDSLRPHGL